MTETAPPSGDPEPVQGWSWTLFVTGSECAVELWRDGEHRITVPLTADQAELLMGRPVTLTGALRDDGLLGMHEGDYGDEDDGDD
jgi:hypothetical protein